MAQVLGRAAAEHEHGRVVVHPHLVEREIRLGAVARALDVGVPARLEVVDDEVQAPLARRRNHRTDAGLEQPMARVEALVALARVAGDDEDGGRHGGDSTIDPSQQALGRARSPVLPFSLHPTPRRFRAAHHRPRAVDPGSRARRHRRFVRPVAAQAPPAPGQPEYKNLKVLPPDITRPRLTAIMRGFGDSLGVHCDFCHAGANGKMDFASDEKDEKKSARVMMKMTWAINKDTLPALEGMSNDAEVTCYTCHRGAKHPPQMTAQLLADTAATKGAASALDEYKKLKAENPDSGLYDVRPQQLAIAAERLGYAEKPDEALALLKAAVALYPDSADVAASLAGALARSGDKAGAEAEYNRALKLDPNNFGAKMGLDRLKNPPPPRQ